MKQLRNRQYFPPSGQFLTIMAVLFLWLPLMGIYVQELLTLPVRSINELKIVISSRSLGLLYNTLVVGLGTALADWTSPYAQWGIFSLLIHGAQGWVAGWLSARWPGAKGLLFAALGGGIIVVAGYLLAGTILVGFGAALTEVPLNIVQVAVGAIVSGPLFAAVRLAYPPITRWRLGD